MLKNLMDLSFTEKKVITERLSNEIGLFFEQRYVRKMSWV